MASRGLLIPPSYLPYIFNTAAVLGLIPIAAGITGVLQPQTGIKLLQFKNATDGPDRKTCEGLFQMYAIRQAFLGVTQIIMWYTGNSTALGLSMLAGTLVAVTDGLVAKQVTGEHVAGHWAAVPLSVFIGTALIGWL